MQKDKTIQFWDNYHDENDSKEWISTPGDELLAMIYDQICIDEGNDETIRTAKRFFSVLEIGCGTSTLVKDLKRYIEERNPMIDVIACGTDVSTVCIEINTKRDCLDVQPDSLINNDDTDQRRNSRGLLWYEVLNALDGEPSRKNWDLIIDKGCLDTFLFRSRTRGGKNKNYPECLRILLDNIHGWQGEEVTAGDAAGTDDEDQLETRTPRRMNSIYLCMTPRPKLKAVKDYSGFSSVKRCSLPQNCQSTLESKSHNAKQKGGVNEGQNRKSSKASGYMYVCTRNDDYVVGVSIPYPID